MNQYPIKVPAIRVEQPLGVFYAVSLPASVLLKTTFSIRTELLNDVDEEQSNFSLGGLRKIAGGQRDTKLTRLEQIRNYSEEVDASFPNAIILGANYNKNGLIEESEKKRWRIINENGCFFLEIPSDEEMASIIDGQHRVYGFKNSKAKNMQLMCSVYLDLPLPYHAQIFTKINMNQKRVDKNLAYNLFQFDMNEGDIRSWSPETLAVYITRILLENKESPLYNNMRLGITSEDTTSTISMASVIDGVLSLISTKPEQDRSMLHKVPLSKRTRSLLAENKTTAPLRQLYLDEKDKSLYNILLNYFTVIKEYFWKEDDAINVLQKTLGIHALFDFLKEVIKEYGANHEYNKDFFYNLFDGVKNVDFNDSYFGIQTKVRTRIKNTLYILCKVKKLQDIRLKDDERKLLENYISQNS